MLYICYIYVIYMLYICYIYVMYMLYITDTKAINHHWSCDQF